MQRFGARGDHGGGGVSTTREASTSCSICRKGVCATCGPVLDRREIAVFILAGLLLLFGMLAVYATTWTLAGNLLLLAAAVVSGRDVLKTAAVSLIRFRFSIAVLIAIAAAGAFLIGNPAEGGPCSTSCHRRVLESTPGRLSARYLVLHLPPDGQERWTVPSDGRRCRLVLADRDRDRGISSRSTGSSLPEARRSTRRLSPGRASRWRRARGTMYTLERSASRATLRSG